MTNETSDKTIARLMKQLDSAKAEIIELRAERDQLVYQHQMRMDEVGVLRRKLLAVTT